MDANLDKQKSKYISINDIQAEYIPLSKKRIRRIVNTYLHTIRVGNKILVERKSLDEFLNNPDRDHIR